MQAPPAGERSASGGAAGADGLLLLAAAIWGFAFVAQRVGMEHVGPFGFTGVRFALGCLVLTPLLLRRDPPPRLGGPAAPGSLSGGIVAGLVLFAGASFQQVALVYTTAGNAGFITGLYVVLVPLLGVAVGQRTHSGAWIGAGLAAVGLYLLSVADGLTIAAGDLLALIGTVFWAVHVHLIGWLSPRRDPIALAFVQNATCSGLSLAVSAVLEQNSLAAYGAAALPILYGGVLSVGVAYTLQVVAQRRAKPTHAAIILSLEAVFAALGGRIFLGEVVSSRGLGGCGLMFAGMLLSQLWRPREGRTPQEA
jgi:drug/metabolite transporter (DMT)-like permease